MALFRAGLSPRAASLTQRSATALLPTFDNGAITGGVRLDEESATDIAAATADKVLNTLEVSGADIAPAAKMELPTSVVGDRSALMGKPAGYIKIKGYLIPVYKTGE